MNKVNVTTGAGRWLDAVTGTVQGCAGEPCTNGKLIPEQTNKGVFNMTKKMENMTKAQLLKVIEESAVQFQTLEEKLANMAGNLAQANEELRVADISAQGKAIDVKSPELPRVAFAKTLKNHAPLRLLHTAIQTKTGKSDLWGFVSVRIVGLGILDFPVYAAKANAKGVRRVFTMTPKNVILEIGIKDHVLGTVATLAKAAIVAKDFTRIGKGAPVVAINENTDTVDGVSADDAPF